MIDQELEDFVVSESAAVSCDGGGGTLGHPRVYLNIGAAREIACPYCSRRFVLAGLSDGAGEAAES